MEFVNPSQNLFPNTGQLFNDVDHIASPDYTQEGVHKAYSGPFSKHIGHMQASKRSERKFVAPVLMSQTNELDIDNIFDSQLPSTFFTGVTQPFASQKKPRCFQVPFVAKNSDEAIQRKNTAKTFPSHTEFSAENVSKVESFINKANGASGQTVNAKPASCDLKASSFRNASPYSNHRTAQVNVIPETPKSVKFSSHDLSTTNPDIIEGSDDECKEEIYGPCLQTPGKFTLPPISTPGGSVKDGVQLRSVEEIRPAHRYRGVFEKIPYFNIVQSKVFDDALYTDKSLVVCAPTGSGKTIVFELAIIRLLINNEKLFSSNKRSKQTKPKIVYMAPIKALCSERHVDWSMKFHHLDLSCQELTGDTDIEDFWQLQTADIILTTPEKWDSMTRRWRDNSSLVRQVKLFMIDEVHLLNDECRGATMEAVVSRMKTIQTSLTNSSDVTACGLRFVAVSATIPNTEDIAEWLGKNGEPALSFMMDDSYRPVKLRKVVLGYPWSSNSSEFKFDISLNYKVGNVIQTYSDNKPTLVFCTTRKSVEMAAAALAKDLVFVNDARQKQTLTQSANLVRNHRLRELLLKGIGYHHAGLDSHDRHLTEELFTQGELLVLVSTSTLAMGVNLPAHLVVIKSTCHYVKGMFQEYTQSEILQMIGRAGRPQFDTSATAVIMTRQQSRGLYLNLVNGTQKIESSLHRHLIEHLNAEIVLTTIHDVTIALEWIRSTFLYIRLLKNPTHYGYSKNLTKEEAEKRLHELCMRNLDSLAAANLVTIDNELRLLSSEPGRLMARYSIAFETIKKFTSLTGEENLSALVEVLSSCREFQDITLRVTERTALNKMNKDKNRLTIRYPMTGRIKTNAMKVSCLLQATLGCMTIQDFALSQDVNKIFRSAMRVSRCLVELQMNRDHFMLLYSSAILAKCIKAKLWENSRYVTKQCPSIGSALSNALANAGVCSFEKLEATDPREIELILNRNPPFGNHLREAVKYLPKYTVRVEQGKHYRTDTCDVTVQVILNNADDLKEKKTAGAKHGCLLLIGDADNLAILKQRLSDSQLMTSNNSTWLRTVKVKRASKGDELSVKLISQDWVGLDVESTYTPYYLGPRRVSATSSGVRTDATVKESKYFDKKRKPCRHTCSNKQICAHECCKVQSDGSILQNNIDKKRKGNPDQNQGKFSVEHLQKFRYNSGSQAMNTKQANQVVPSTPSLQRSKGWEHLDSFCGYQQTQELEGEMLESMNAFEREQSYYDDQINLGSRINYGGDKSLDCSLQSGGRKRSLDGQLWTEDAPTQVEEPIVIDDEIEEIQPRAFKYGLKKAKEMSIPFKNSDLPSSSAPKRMGKVVAWKSESIPKNSVFSTQVECLGGATQSDLTSAATSSHHYQNSSLAPQFQIPPRNSVFSSTPMKQQPSTPCWRTTAFSAVPNVTSNPPKPSTSIHSNRPQSQRVQNSQNVNSKNSTSKANFNAQLWEEAPSYLYPPFAKKKTTFFDAFPISQKLNDPTCPIDEKDVDIDCDFSLEDEDDLLMEACIQVEERENSAPIEIEESPKLSPPYPVMQFPSLPMAAVTQPPAPKKVLPKFFGNEKPQKMSSMKKVSEIADARKMFDSIFDGIF